MSNLIHKSIICIIGILFVLGVFFVRDYVNNSIIPDREKKLAIKLSNEINVIRDNYQNKLYIDAHQSSLYLINNFKDKLIPYDIEELKLIYADSLSKIAIKKKEKIDINNSIENFIPLTNSEFLNIKIKALYSISKTIMSLPEKDIKNINKSILYLNNALILSRENDFKSNNLSYFYAITLLEKYKIENKTKIKIEAIDLLEKNIIYHKKFENIDILADSKINLALLYVELSKKEQAKRNLNKATIIVEETKDMITRQYNPRKNAKIMRILGDVYYLRSKLPTKNNNEIQDIVKFRTKSNKAYKKAEQMGFFQDILPGVKELKLKDASNRKKMNDNRSNNINNEEQEKK